MKTVGDKDRRVKIPEDAKVTFGPAIPDPSKEHFGPREMEYAVRVYRGANRGRDE